MNAGTSYDRAKQQAQANANLAREPRWLHSYAGSHWISRTAVEGGERVDPAPEVLRPEDAAAKRPIPILMKFDVSPTSDDTWKVTFDGCVVAIVVQSDNGDFDGIGNEPWAVWAVKKYIELRGKS